MIKYFNNFLRYSMLTVISIILAFTFLSSCYFILKSTNLLLALLLLLLLSFCTYTYSKDIFNIRTKALRVFNKNNIVQIILLSFAIRLLWIILIPTTPISDFALMYDSGLEVSKGNYGIFQGTAYFARFAHNTVTVLYFSLFYRIVDNPLILIKLVNVIFQTISVYAIYLLTKQIYNNEKLARICAFTLCIFPPFVMYTSQTISENIAIPFYIFSVYFFFKSMGSRRVIFYLILSGLFLSTANLFRMVGTVFIIAYVVYSLLYDGVKIALKRSFIIVIPFYIILFIFSTIVMNLGIIETHLWNSKEPSTTSILKGTNVKSFGMWNSEDAILPEKFNFDKSKVKQESINIIKERLSTTPIYQLVPFFIIKLASQWGFGDFGSYSWTVTESKNTLASEFLKDNQALVMILSNFVLMLLLIKTFKAYKQNKENNKFNYFFTILFGGYVLLYLITEMQPRYAFIVAWLFIVLPYSYNLDPHRGIKEP